MILIHQRLFVFRHKEGADPFADLLDTKYPVILKTSIGSQGVGVMFVENENNSWYRSQLIISEMSLLISCYKNKLKQNMMFVLL